MQYEKTFKNLILLYFFVLVLSLIPSFILGDFFTPNPEYVFVNEDAPESADTLYHDKASDEEMVSVLQKHGVEPNA